MIAYTFKRVGAAILTILLIASVTFLLMYAVPGSPFLTERSTPEQIEMANKRYGLDKPRIVQLKNYLVNYLKGDMGVSLKMQEGTPVTKIIFGQNKFALSFKLGVLAMALGLVLGIPFGCIGAYNRGKGIDGFLRVVTTIGVAIPGFVAATLLLTIFAVKLKWVPVRSNSLATFAAYVCPVLALSLGPTCNIAKLTRTSMLDVINQDYIRTARAKGLNTKKIIFKHALRNSLIPVITYLGPVTAYIITGGFVVETTFCIPGLGKYFVSCITNRDYPVIMGTTVVLASLIIMMNLVVDIAYKIVDPRISLTSKEE